MQSGAAWVLALSITLFACSSEKSPAQVSQPSRPVVDDAAAAGDAAAGDAAAGDAALGDAASSEGNSLECTQCVGDACNGSRESCSSSTADSGVGKALSTADSSVSDALLQQSCEESKETDACYKCEDEVCCETYAAYQASPDAVAFKECFQACETGACEEACASEYPEGLALFAPRLTCLTTLCPACLAEPDAVGQNCLNSKCQRESLEASATSQGFMLQSCVAYCPTDSEACLNACFAQYPEAVPALYALRACALSLCHLEF